MGIIGRFRVALMSQTCQPSFVCSVRSAEAIWCSAARYGEGACTQCCLSGTCLIYLVTESLLQWSLIKARGIVQPNHAHSLAFGYFGAVITGFECEVHSIG